MSYNATLRILALAAFAAALTLALIWVPHGMTMLGVIEEWGLLGVFEEHGPIFLAAPDTPFSALKLRPLNIMPQALAYVLTPSSFFGWHLLQWLSFAAKAVAMSYIVWWLLRSAWMAAFAGLLFMMFPADTMQISLRALHINWAVAFSVSGVSLLLASTVSKQFVGRILLAFAASILFLVGSFTYEAGLFLAPLPLLVWWCRSGFKDGLRELRKQPVAIVLWIASCGIATVYLVIVGRSDDIYQSSISSNPISTLLTIAGRLPLLFEVGLYRVALNSWFDAARMLWMQGWQWTTLVAVIVFFALAATSMRTPQAAFGSRSWIAVRLFIAGVLAAALGYAPYLSSLSHVLITQRTYTHAAAGGTLMVVSLVYAISLWRRPAGLIVGVLFLTVGFAAQSQQMAHYVDLSRKQRMLLSGILEASTSVDPNRKILVIDESGYFGNTWMLKGKLLASALTYLKQRKVDVETCLAPSQVWASFSVGPNGQVGNCVEHESYWELGGNIGAGQRLEKADLVKIVINPDGNVVLDENDSQPRAATPAEAERWGDILGCWPASACAYTGAPATASYRYDFGDWWSLEQAPWGAGWRDAMWTVPSPAPRSISWMIAPTSRLWFRIIPSDLPYVVRVKVAQAVSAEAQQGLAIAVNGRPLSLTEGERQVWEAEIPAGVLTGGRNELLLSAPLDPVYGVSVAVDWVEISPASQGVLPAQLGS